MTPLQALIVVASQIACAVGGYLIRKGQEADR